MHGKHKIPAFLAAFLFSFALAPVCGAEALLRVFVASPVLPIVHGVTQSIGVELASSSLTADRVYEAEISTESGLGVLMLDGGPAESGRIRCRAGEPLTILYRWAGPVPTEHAIAERVKIHVPELSHSASVSFSVGMNLQVNDILVPKELLPGVPTSVDVSLRDTFHPDAALPELLSNLGITPELRLSLEAEGVVERPSASEDAMVKRFLGDARPTELASVYPEAFTAGRLQKDGGGHFLWRDTEGRPPSVTLLSPEKFRLLVYLKANAGGTAVKTFRSGPFSHSGGEVPGAVDIPFSGVAGSTLRIMSYLNMEAYEAASGEMREALQGGGEDVAARSLGSFMKDLSGADQASFLREYVLALLAYDARVDEMAPYIRNFLGGYEGYGVLILTRSGVASWSVGSQGEAKIGPSSEGGALSGDAYVVVPFRIGENFILNISGSGKGDTALWKIIPEGVNVKRYPQGSWRKEITVYTGQLLPPEKRAK